MLGSSASLSMCLLNKAVTLKQDRGMRIAVRLFHQTANACTSGAVLFADLRQRHAGAAVSDDLLPVDIEPRTPNLPSFKLCPTHSGPNPFDDQTSFKLSNRGHDDDHGATQRPRRVDVFAETD